MTKLPKTVEEENKITFSGQAIQGRNSVICLQCRGA